MARRKESETVQVGLRMKEPLRATLDEVARQRGVSMNAEIVARLERTLGEEDRFGGPAMLPIVNMLAGAFLRGGRLGAAAMGHPEWTPDRWLNDPFCYRAAAYAVGQALNLPLPTEASMTDPSAVHDLLTGMIARGVPMRVSKSEDK
jgi:hypothetical protein